MREQKLFLALLRDHIHSTATAEITEGIDWEQLFSYAEEQSLCGVCYVQLKALAGSGKHIPEEILEKFHQGFFYDCYASANRQAYMKEAEALLQEADIPFQPFKGWILKDYWPVPELRTMGGYRSPDPYDGPGFLQCDHAGTRLSAPGRQSRGVDLLCKRYYF